MGFLYERKEKKGTPYIEITGYEGKIAYLNVPEKIDSLPVRSIGDHAFSGRQDILEVRLPDTVKRLGRFCFYDCENLRLMQLYDGVNDYYDGVIRECRGLQEIVVVVRGNQYRIVKEMMEDNKEVLHFTLRFPESSGKTEAYGQGDRIVRLTIPAYHDEDREDTMARAIHPKIVGAGYAYRQTVTRTEIHYGEYDSLFEEKGKNEDVQVAADIALDRLSTPYQLQQEAARQYRSYLQEHAREVIGLIIKSGDTGKITALLRNADVQQADVDFGLQLASEDGKTEIAGLLMEYNRRQYAPLKRAEVFSL